MKAVIDTVDVDAAAARAAEAELRRMATLMEPGYYKRVAEGTMPRAEANARMAAMASAILLCRAAAAALEEQAAARDLPLQGTGGAGRTAGTAAPTLPPLPYDKGASVAGEPPRCRLCLSPGEGDGGHGWRCTREGCLGRVCWTTRKLFEGGAA